MSLSKPENRGFFSLSLPSFLPSLSPFLPPTFLPSHLSSFPFSFSYVYLGAKPGHHLSQINRSISPYRILLNPHSLFPSPTTTIGNHFILGVHPEVESVYLCTFNLHRWCCIMDPVQCAGPVPLQSVQWCMPPVSMSVGLWSSICSHCLIKVPWKSCLLCLSFLFTSGGE